MNKAELQKRTQAFHVAVIKACEGLPKNAAGFELAKQVIRSAGSVGANNRAANRAKSKADFIYKLEIIIEEADESMYWIEVIEATQMLPVNITKPLLQEANELVSIFVAAVKTTKAKQNTQYSQINTPNS